MIRLILLFLALQLAPLAHADDGLDALVLDPACTALCPGGDATGIVTGQTDLPASVTAASIGDTGHVLYSVLLP